VGLLAYFSYSLFFLSSLAFFCAAFVARFTSLSATLHGMGAKCSVSIRCLGWHHPGDSQGSQKHMNKEFRGDKELTNLMKLGSGRIGGHPGTGNK
jgi:hypothetical protein